MDDLSKRLREMAVQRETVTPDEHGVRILSAILNRNKRLMSEAADTLDARDATHVDKADAWDAVTAKRPRWQTMENAPRDGTSVLLFAPNHGVTIGSNSFEVFGGDHSGRWWVQGGAGWTPTHWQPLPEPPQ